MLNPSMWSEITAHINATCNEDQAFVDAVPIYGGDINQSFHLQTSKNDYFVKTNRVQFVSMFQQERFCLEQMQGFCPMPVVVGEYEHTSFFVLEYVPLTSHGDEGLLAKQVSKLHQKGNQRDTSTQNPASRANPTALYGWPNTNYIGTNLQRNNWHTDWSEFWWNMRIEPQLELLYNSDKNHTLLNLKSDLCKAIESSLNGHQPYPSLLHGDLWSGNKGYIAKGKLKGQAIVFDPASYYGDYETDLAMTELFGGFGSEFYQNYFLEREENKYLESHKKGYENRKIIYNLYHLLNHLNLFGESYKQQCKLFIEKIIKDNL